MESGLYYFSVFVIGFSVFHLIWKAAALIEKMSNNLGRNKSLKKRQKPQRDDWYMFFHRSDLTGWKPEKESTVASADKADSLRKTKRRKRPAARAYLA